MTATQVFRPMPLDGFAWVHPIDEIAREQLDRISGIPILDWVPPTVEFAPSNDRAPHTDRLPDVPWRGENTLIFRDRAFGLVRPILEPWGQFLELRTADSLERLWMFNVCTLIDALDEDASEIGYFPDGVRIIMVMRWELRRDMLSETMIFRIPKQRTLLLTGDVVRQLEALPITGLGFKLVWDAG